MLAIDEQIKLFEEALLSIDRVTARHILEDLVNRDTSFETLAQVMVSALERIGHGWENGSVALSQVYMSGRICEELVGDLIPMNSTTHTTQPKLAITVLDDYHLLGKRMVYSVLRTRGFEVQDYGRQTVSELVKRVLKDKIELLLISVLMLPSALRVQEVCAALMEAGASTKVVVGGAPFRLDKQLWREVGAFAMGNTAAESIGIVDGIIGGGS